MSVMCILQMKMDFQKLGGIGGVALLSRFALRATNETTLAMKTITVSRIFVFCIFAPHATYAQGEPREPRGERPSFRAVWEKYDTDGDGFLSFQEFQEMPRIARLSEEQQLRLFSRLDKNEDGKVSQNELRHMRQGRKENRPARGMRRLMELDADGSGGVSLEEFRAGEMFANLPPERVEAMFGRLDTDGDGQITLNDRPQLPPNARHPNGPRGERGERGERQPEPQRRRNRPMPSSESPSE